MEKRLTLGAFTVVAALMTTSVLADTRGPAGPGYVADAGGEVVLNSTGDCVRTSTWNKDMATATCDAELLPRLAAVQPAPEPAAPAKPEPVLRQVVERMTLREDALFDIAKAELRPNGKFELDALARQLIAGDVSIEQVMITGHASAPGTKTFNQRLSERRAETVKSYLAGKGIDPNRIFTQGMGETQPIASNSTAEGRALNRRVEIEIKAKKTTMVSN